MHEELSDQDDVNIEYRVTVVSDSGYSVYNGHLSSIAASRDARPENAPRRRGLGWNFHVSALLSHIWRAFVGQAVHCFTSRFNFLRRGWIKAHGASMSEQERGRHAREARKKRQSLGSPPTKGFRFLPTAKPAPRGTTSKRAKRKIRSQTAGLGMGRAPGRPCLARVSRMREIGRAVVAATVY